MFPSGRAAPGGGRRVSAALCCFAAGKMASRRITRETFDAVVQDKVKRYRAERGDALQEAMHHFKGNGTRRGCGGCPRVWPRRSAALLRCCAAAIGLGCGLTARRGRRCLNAGCKFRAKAEFGTKESRRGGVSGAG